MLRKKFLIIAFVLAGSLFSVAASANTCPSASPQGVGCTAGTYYCSGSCRSGLSWCPTWSPSPTCASGLSCANCSSADTCGVCNACNSGYRLCGAYPNSFCKDNSTLPANCASYNTNCDGCSSCVAGYTLSGSACVAATLKLGSSSVSGTNVAQGGSDSILFVSGNKIGIGNSAPAANLQLHAATDTEGLRIISSNYSPFVIRNAADDADLFRIDQDGNITGSGSFGGASFWNLDGTNLYASSTDWNVGIGTTDPGAKLDLNGSLRANSSVTLSLFAGGGTRMLTIDNSGVLGAAAVPIGLPSGTSGYTLRYDGSNWVSNSTIFNNGTNVGIGTTNPGTRLTVVGSGNYSIDAGNYRVGNVAAPFSDLDAVNKSYLDSAISSATSSITLWGGSTAGNIWSLASGNVGIGTTNPTRKLTIGVSSGYDGVYINADSTSAYPTLTLNRISNVRASQTVYSTSGTTDWATGIMYNSGSANSLFSISTDSTLANSKLVINSSGNVGIGTTNPSYPLDISGAIRTSGSVISKLSTSNYDYKNVLHYQNNSPSQTGAMVIGFTSAGSSMLFIRISGYDYVTNRGAWEAVIGGYWYPTSTTWINTSAEIRGSAPFRSIKLMTDASGNPKIVLGETNTVWQYPQFKVDVYAGYGGQANFSSGWDASLSADLSALTLKSSPTIKTYVDSSGNVGIGTTSPSTKLDILGSLKVSNSAQISLLGGSGNRMVTVDDSGTFGTSALPTAVNEVADLGVVVFNQTGTTTADFIAKLEDLGAFDNYHSIMKASWSYAGNADILDTGFGALELAGCVVETWTDNADDVVRGNINVRVTRTTTGSGASQILVYNDQGGTYSPGWRQIWTSATDGSGSGLDADLWDGQQFASYLNQAVLTTSAPTFTDLTLNGGDLTINNNSGGINFSDVSAYWLRTATNWGIYWDTAVNQLKFNGSGITRSFIDLDDGTAYFNGNVGIGTTNPGTRLTVVGSGNYSIDAGNYRVGNVAAPFSDLDAVNKSYLDSAISSATSSITLWGGSTAGNIWSLASGNVGIGTTNPEAGAKLHVTGSAIIDAYTAGAGSGLYFRSPGFIGGTEINKRNVSIRVRGLASPATPDGLEINGNDGIIFGTGGANDRMVIDGSGNVGIGTTNPGTRLTVVGSGNYSIDAGNYRVGNVAAPFSDLDAVNKSYLDSAISSATSSITLWGGSTAGNIWSLASGNVGIGTTNPAYKLQVQQTSDIYSQGIGVINTAVSASLRLWLDGTTARIDNTGNQSISINSSGNVGIGTTNPGYKLDVNGIIKTNNRIMVESGNGTTAMFLADEYGVSESGLYSGGGYRIATYHDYDSVFQYADGAIYASSGNVGIGTSTPTAKLHIAGGLKLESSNPLIDLMDTNGADWKISLQDNHLSFLGNDGVTEYVRFNNGGNVGIGTTNPGTRLTVVGSGNYSIDAGNYRVGNVAAPFSDLDAVNKSYLDSAISSATSSITLWGGSTAGNIWSLASGNVGIGTTNPGAYKLNVAGSIYSTGMTLGGDVNLGSNNITGVNKLTVNTIDPLYSIKGVNYSTFASAIVGGVKEEYVGRTEINQPAGESEYEKIIDFDKLEKGSDLWVWRQVVDFTPDNVQVFLTPYGDFASTYYDIIDNRLIFRADRPTEISYRLIGKRFDWRQWPTKALDQSEKAGFVIH